jgi:TonB family protein
MVNSSALVAVLMGLVIAPAWAQEVYYPGNGVTLPTVIKEIHLMGATDAKVGIDCVVTQDGTVTDVTIASSPDSRLNEPAVRALRLWQFKPGTKGGQAVSVRISVEVTVVRG